MLCFPCAQAGDDSPAVALCPHCQAGLCLWHVAEAAADPGPGGLRLGCAHATWDTATYPLPQTRRTRA